MGEKLFISHLYNNYSLKNINTLIFSSSFLWQKVQCKTYTKSGFLCLVSVRLGGSTTRTWYMFQEAVGGMVVLGLGGMVCTICSVAPPSPSALNAFTCTSYQSASVQNIKQFHCNTTLHCIYLAA